MNEELILRLEDEPELSLQLDDEISPLELQIGDPVPVVGTKNYEELYNKPKIDGNELIGNMSLSELLSGGLILDGGTAEEVTA